MKVNQIPETYEDYLAHYGVKGMKWGVRKGRRSGSKASRTSNSPASKRNRKETAKKVAKAAAITAGAAAATYVVAKHGPQLKKTAVSALKDRSYEKKTKQAKKALAKRNIGLEMRNSLASDITRTHREIRSNFNDAGHYVPMMPEKGRIPRSEVRGRMEKEALNRYKDRVHGTNKSAHNIMRNLDRYPTELDYMMGNGYFKYPRKMGL